MSSHLTPPHPTSPYPMPSPPIPPYLILVLCHPTPAHPFQAKTPSSSSGEQEMLFLPHLPLCFLPPAPWETSRHPCREGPQVPKFKSLCPWEMLTCTRPWCWQVGSSLPALCSPYPLPIPDPRFETQLLTKEFSEFQCPHTKLTFQFSGVPARRVRFSCTVYYFLERERSGLNEISHCKSHLHEWHSVPPQGICKAQARITDAPFTPVYPPNRKLENICFS